MPSRVEEVLKKKLDPVELVRIFRRKQAKLGRGVDRIDSAAFERRMSVEVGHASRKAINGKLKFSPYQELLISKGRDKPPRVIARPTIRDNLVLSALKDALHEELPADVPRKLPNQVIRELLNALKVHKGASILRFDIKSFYDSIPHAKLLPMVRKRVGNGLALGLIREAISGYIVPEGYRRLELSKYAIRRGVPQGLPISNFLAHIYLSRIDQKLSDLVLAYFRYVDDILVITTDDEAIEVDKSFSKSLAGLGLKVNKEKSRAIGRGEKFDFLGYEIDGGFARPRRASIEKFIRSIAAMFSSFHRGRFIGRRSDSWSPDERGWVFVEELNERITGAINGGKQYGWVFYFNESTDLSVFAGIDSVIKKMAYRTDELTSGMRHAIKTTLRAYHESKYSKLAGYILNYDANSSIEDKANFLLRLKYVERSALGGMSDQAIDALYASRVSERLSRLEKDVGLIS